MSNRVRSEEDLLKLAGMHFTEVFLHASFSITENTLLSLMSRIRTTERTNGVTIKLEMI